MNVECILCNGPHVDTDDSRKHAPISSEDMDRALAINAEDVKRRVAERDAVILASAEKWSSEVVCAVTGKPLPHDTSHQWHGAHEGQLIDNVFDAPIRDGGEAFVIRCGYGSKHDGSMILLGISDEALDDLIASGRARVIGEYM